MNVFPDTPILIRQIEQDDAPAFLDLCNRLDEETDFRMFEPGERQTTGEQQRRILHDFLVRPNHTILVAERDGDLIGYLSAGGGHFHRNYHSVQIVAAVLQAHAGQGIGTRLFIELERWALENQVHRLELTVMANNRGAIGLYKKMGFEVEGLKHHALCVDGVYIDEYLMARLLD